jgi:hypothetical protein
MTVFATDSNCFSLVVKHEYEPASAFCRDVLTVYDVAQTMKVGTVLGKFLASPTGTAGSTVGTGNGAMGAITVTSVAGLETGVYTLKIVKAAANAGDFVVTKPNGSVMGYGTVGVAFSQGGLAFTLADGSTDFVVGDSIPITVAGTAKYKKVEATATDGSQIAAAIMIGDTLGYSGDIAVAATTDTKVLALTRGPALVSKGGLVFGSSVDTQAELDLAYAQLTALGMLPVEAV